MEEWSAGLLDLEYDRVYKSEDADPRISPATKPVPGFTMAFGVAGTCLAYLAV